MSSRRRWCDVCRGEADGEGDLSKCSSCPRRFHYECCPGLSKDVDLKKWKCPFCTTAAEGDGPDEDDKLRIKAAKEAAKKTRALHTALKGRSCGFYQREHKRLAPFVPADRLKALQKATSKAKQAAAAYSPVKKIGPSEEYIHAEIRPYQQEGVNWLLRQYDTGVGAILADEMGLGKTLQTLSFLSALKADGMPGPHLVVTPLAVLQNWHNEIKRFTPGLSVIKVHGSRSERDRILSMPVVLAGGFDIYLTTYETVLSEEPFFTESFLFHTITIDEGHRLKNESGQLCASLARLTVPFRLLLTGTPLQNNLNELWALMQYILPDALEGCKDTFDAACSLEEGQLDRAVVDQARSLLESLMIRRVKSEVETSLLPKVHWVLKVPLSTLQRQWYRRFLSKDSEAQALVTRKQLIAKIQQLQKIINHPKVILHALDRERETARSLRRRAEGSEFISLPEVLDVQPEAAQVMEAELRGLRGLQLIQSSGKLQMLDRLLSRVRASGSRVLLFSQFTLTLDVLAEYCQTRFGPEGRGFVRLDGSTNRIKREMDVRAFNAPNSRIPIYLISTRAGGQGINLATADVVVLYDTCWNPQVDLQAQDRAHRIGQKKQVKVFRLIAEATLEERVLTRARQKLVLDALVIKKKEEASALANEVGDEVDATDEAAMEKLSLDELWSFLSFGAEQVQDPMSDESVEPLTDVELDRIIDQGRAKENAEEMEEAEALQESSAAAKHGATGGADGGADDASSTVDLTVDASDESDDEGDGKKRRKFPKPRGRPPSGMKWNSRTGVWVPQDAVDSPAQARASPARASTSAAAAAAASEPSTSINVVSAKTLKSALGSKSAVAAKILAVRKDSPFVSRRDCAARVDGLGETKLVALEQAGITFPSGQQASRAAAKSSAYDGLSVAESVALHSWHGAQKETAEASALKAVQAVRPGGRAVKSVKRYEPPTMHHNKGKRRKLRHEDDCFSCGDGGELIECSVCPKVYHATADCAGLMDNKVPKGTWICPWHECWECDRKSSQAGGMLFHCTKCPLAYCFDCAPDKYTTQRTGTTAHKHIAAMLENRGCVSTKSYLFFTCDDCDPKRVEREAAEEAMREAAEKRAEAERQRLIAWNRPEAVAARAEAAKAAQLEEAAKAERKRQRDLEWNRPENVAKREALANKKSAQAENLRLANIRAAWEQHFDAGRGLHYWWNRITLASRWTHPEQDLAAQEQQAAAAAAARAAAKEAAAATAAAKKAKEAERAGASANGGGGSGGGSTSAGSTTVAQHEVLDLTADEGGGVLLPSAVSAKAEDPPRTSVSVSASAAAPASSASAPAPPSASASASPLHKLLERQVDQPAAAAAAAPKRYFKKTCTTCSKQWGGRKLSCDCGAKNSWDKPSTAQQPQPQRQQPRLPSAGGAASAAGGDDGGAAGANRGIKRNRDQARQGKVSKASAAKARAAAALAQALGNR
jgi:SWI/SNF-related matrix-associated actin-dependent regulator of chromatin subfamily A member 5